MTHNKIKKTATFFETSICSLPGGFVDIGDVRNFAEMFITHIKKWRKRETDSEDNLYVGYNYYRLSEAYRTADGKPRNRVVMGLGELDDFSKPELKELGMLLTSMIDRGELALASSPKVHDKALEFYNKYKNQKRLEREIFLENERLQKEAEKKAEENRRDTVLVKLSTLCQKEARTVGAENICMDTVNLLGIKSFLRSQKFSEQQASIAVLQIIARAVYPGSELRTVRCLQENSALCELLGIDSKKVTKDTLYRSAARLWEIHREMEDYLHRHVSSLFNIEEKIYLFDLTNTYFEGRMSESEICFYGRSKEKRDDCKIVALGAVVNTDGLLVRTEIFEGNRQDVDTLEEVIGSLDNGLSSSRKIIVMDAGFCSKSNLQWLRNHNYDYITVMRSSGVKYTASSEVVEKVYDNKEQEIRLQKVTVEGIEDDVLLVDSTAKTLKEKSMFEKSVKRYEEGLKNIKKAISGKGVKKRDLVQKRIGKLEAKYPKAAKSFSIKIEYDAKDRAVSFEYARNEEIEEGIRALHGKYLLQTTLKDLNEKNIWTFYNVIRTVEETFKTLKSDLDIRPVFHKSDTGTKAHLNLAVLAYWIVSTTKYRLTQKKINIRWSELLRILSAQVRVTAEFETGSNHRLAIRKSTEPEEKAHEIYDALGITTKNFVTLKSVVHPKGPPQKNDS